MYRFPINPERRKLWMNRVRRVGWEPTSSSFLCQEHFDHHQFEHGRADGKRKLKITAAPTIISHRNSPRVRKSPKKRSSTCTAGNKACMAALLQDHNYFATRQNGSSSNAAEDTASEQEDVQTSQKVAQSLKKMKGRMKQLKADLRQTKKTCRGLVKAKAKHEARVSRLFGRDQLRALARGGMRNVELKAEMGRTKKEGLKKSAWKPWVPFSQRPTFSPFLRYLLELQRSFLLKNKKAELGTH
uniref:THAP domain-containing protein 2-like n=1 Tax=Myxine glutinosa TaxID=7769 RepID=UPI00358DE053